MKNSYVIFVAIFALVLIVFLPVSCARHASVYHHHQLNSEMEVVLSDLKHHRPGCYTLQQWDYLLGWTINCYGNCINSNYRIDAGRYSDFIKCCKRKLDNKSIDDKFIDWYWDQVVELSSAGKYYSDNYRPTSPSILKTIDKETFQLGVE